MQCPSCGATMNRHVEKPIKGRPEDSKRYDPAIGGAIAAIHTCPGCGKVESKPKKTGG
jgi:predicted RNA-binding Zn-ribbon protein involved in translation (DUF1610 family)